MNIEIKDLLQKAQINSLNIIDIRDEYSYRMGHISNAKNIPALYLMQNPQNYLNIKNTYYIYCDAGNTSKKVVNTLNAMGYHTINVNGGYNNYLLWK